MAEDQLPITPARVSRLLTADVRAALRKCATEAAG